MATIQFENGMKVNFNGNPSPKDIEEVAQKLGIKPPKGTPAPAPVGVGGIKGVGLGIAKGIGSTVAGASSLGERGLAAATRGIGHLIGSETLKQTRPSGIGEAVQKEFLSPQGTAEKIGFGVEQAGEFLAPIPGGAKAKLLLKATEKAPFLVKGAKALARVGTDAIEAAGKGAIQKGSTEQFGGEVAAQAGFSAVLGLIGPLGKLGGSVLGKTTGTSGAVIKEAFDNPKVRDFMRKAAVKGPDAVQEQALVEAKDSLGAFVRERGQKYVQQLQRLKGEKIDYGEIKSDALNKVREAFDGASVKINKAGKLGVNAFKDSAVEQGKNNVLKAYRVLTGWKDTTPAGLDLLKKKLNQFKTAVKNTSDGSYNIIKTMANSVDEGLKVNVPGYKKMTSGYRAASDTIDEIERALSLGDRASKETAIKKLMGSLRENNEVRGAILRKLQGKTGKDIVGKLAGSELSSPLPKGLAGRIATGAAGPAGLYTLMNPTTWPLLLTTAAASSPRFVGEIVSLLGSIDRGLPKAQLENALQGIISQMFLGQNPKEGADGPPSP